MLEYFKKFFSQDVIEMIVENTNLYSPQKQGRCINTNNSEISDFLGIELIMGIIQLSEHTDYWVQATRIPQL